jgi:hypothetical protein
MISPKSPSPSPKSRISSKKHDKQKKIFTIESLLKKSDTNHTINDDSIDVVDDNEITMLTPNSTSSPVSQTSTTVLPIMMKPTLPPASSLPGAIPFLQYPHATAALTQIGYDLPIHPLLMMNPLLPYQGYYHPSTNPHQLQNNLRLA